MQVIKSEIDRSKINLTFMDQDVEDVTVGSVTNSNCRISDFTVFLRKIKSVLIDGMFLFFSHDLLVVYLSISSCALHMFYNYVASHMNE